ncbi:hypothetical protein NFI96_032438 [Prochilodus magdalenae]|nr:hypothetical protein NFI96_032438 [Prochilodus magdalenae]
MFSIDDFSSFGYVFEGWRISDGLQVAIKFVAKRPSDEYLRNPIESKVVPIEVTLMQMMSQPPVCKNTARFSTALQNSSKKGRYHADPATVWSLGVLLFRIVCGHLALDEEQDIITVLLDFKDGLSEGTINGSIWDT